MFQSYGGEYLLDESNRTSSSAVGRGLHVAANTLFVTDTGHLEIVKTGEDFSPNGDELGFSFLIKHKGMIEYRMYRKLFTVMNKVQVLNQPGSIVTDNPRFP